MDEYHHLLLVESSMGDAFLIVSELEKAGLAIEFERIETASYMEQALNARQWDFIICDAYLPDFSWAQALEIYKRKDLDIPFIIVADTQDEDLSVERIKAGVHDHVLKDCLPRLPLVVKRELCAAQARRFKNVAVEKDASLTLIHGLTAPLIQAEKRI
jgi:DNA-binding NtrC family response regulator